MYFYLDTKEMPTTDGIKVPTFEYGITPLGAYKNVERVVLNLPGHHKVNSFKSLSLFCVKYEQNFGSVTFPEPLHVPRPQFLATEMKGSRFLRKTSNCH